MSVSTPILTNTIPQNFFIDALNGPSNVLTFLSNFPDTVYSKAVDSHLYILMYALLGPSGVGLLTQQWFEERLQNEASSITGSLLDALYSGSFGFQRLADESYLWDIESQLLPANQRAQVLTADASFRNRARLWMQAVRAGGSILGIGLAASSGFGRSVEAIENYKALFDQYSDMPLGLEYFGSTDSLDEIILIPRNNIPNNTSFTFAFDTPPTSGQFTITVPIGPPYVMENIDVSTIGYDAEIVTLSPSMWLKLNDPYDAITFIDYSGNNYTNTSSLSDTNGEGTIVPDAEGGPIPGNSCIQVMKTLGPLGRGGDVPWIQTSYVPPNAPFTIAIWYNLITSGGTLIDTRIINESSHTFSNGYYLGFNYSLDSPTSYLQFGLGNSSNICVSSIASGLNSWYFAVGTWDGTTLSLYQNGTLVSQVTPGANVGTSSKSLIIANSRDDSDPFGGIFGGYIAEMSVFSTALTSTQVLDLYESQNSTGTSTAININTDLLSIGTWINIENNIYTCTAILGPDTIQLSPAPPDYSGNSIIGRSETLPIAYNATAYDIQEALGILSSIGGLQNVQCYGGPLPNPITITFIGILANTSINALIINTLPDTNTKSTGLTPSNINPIITPIIAGIEVDNLPIGFSESDLSLMLEAVDVLRPQTTFLSTTLGRSLYSRQIPNNYFVDQTYTDVQQYITGNTGIDWPTPDGVTNWIEDGVEHESPQLAGGYHSQYTNFHNILNTISYTQDALDDPNYNTPLNAPVQPFYASYFDSHVGRFSQAQQILYPYLAQYQDTSIIFEPNYAIASQPNQPQITTVTEELITLINDTYPSSYLNLPGVNYQSTSSNLFWASNELPSGTDYLEIDLGYTQPINFIYFEATNKPYSISIAYESLDQSTTRAFTDALVTNAMPSVTSLSYSPIQSNPWTAVYLPIANTMNTMIYSRYIRIGFTRTSAGQPFQDGDQLLPYSIEVRNLRIGRVVNSFGVSNTSLA